MFFAFLIAFFLHLESPIVVFSVGENGFHVLQSILIQASGVDGADGGLVSRTGNFVILPNFSKFFFILRIILLYEIIQFICLPAKVRTTVPAIVGSVFLIVGEDLIKTTSFGSAGIPFPVALLESLPVWLKKN